MSDPFIHVDEFGITLGDKDVIKNLSFEVHKGETFALLGSNGSGKTTTLRALLGIYSEFNGLLTIGGEPFHPGSNVQVGYLPEERGLYAKESVLDCLVFFGQLRGMTTKNAVAWSLNYLNQVDLRDKAKVKVAKLSSGQQQKIQLGTCIINDPELLILDEPTKGFDPVNRQLLIDIIMQSKARGATIIFVTHQMDEVERLCDRLLLLKDGYAAAYGTVEQVKRMYYRPQVKVHFRGALPESDQYTVVSSSEDSAVLESDLDDSHLLRTLVEKGAEIDEFFVVAPSLDKVFLQIYGAASSGARS